MTTAPTAPSEVSYGLYYLAELLRGRLVARRDRTPYAPPLPEISDDGSPFAAFLQEFAPTPEEYVLLLLGLLPETAPGLVQEVLTEAFPEGHDLPYLGGIRGQQYRGFLPTGETARFLLGGEAAGARTQVQSLLDGRLGKENILLLEDAPPGEPLLAGRLRAQEDWLARVLDGRRQLPAFSTTFPAHRLTPRLSWSDLVLPKRTERELTYLRNHLEQQDRVRENPSLHRHFRPGYRALFSGPPGTGKTLTAGLLGTVLNRPTFRIDVSAVVSKYIGETEKNLAALFDRAERQGWILFFDEADALFGRRSEVKESKDRYANQETSYLLQRIEHHDGTVILATNLRRNLDLAFLRRFEAVVPFEIPDAPERARLWRQLWPESLPLNDDIDLETIARRHALTGSAIANVLRFALTETYASGQPSIDQRLLTTALRREYEKDSRDWKG